MTSVTITFEEKPDRQCYSIEAYGHADYATDGEDIVCASVSMLIYTLARRLEDLGYDFIAEFNGGDAFVGFTNEGPAIMSTRYAFETIESGFRLLAETYPGHVSLDVVVV